MEERKNEQDAQQERLERYQQETQEQKAARVAQERATEQKAKEALESLPNSLKTPFGIEIFYDPDDTEDAGPEEYLTGAALDAARELMQRANDIVRDQITKYLSTPDFERIEAVFPDARQWTVDELDESPETALLILTAVFYCLDYIPDYLKEKNIEPSLSIFSEYQQQDDGTTTSTLEDFLKYLQSIDLAAAAEVGKVGKELLTPSAQISTHGILSDRVVNEMIKGAALPSKHTDGQGVERWLYGFNQAPKDTKQVPVFIGLSDKNGAPIKTSRYIEAEDWTILDSIGDIIVTSILQGATYPIKCTPDEIWRKENRIEDKSVSPSTSQRNEIISRMHKMRFTELFMDLTAEANANYINELEDDRIKEGIVDTYFVEATYKAIRTEKGREVYGYEFPVMPFLIKYCIAKNHMTFIDYDLLDTSDTTSGLMDVEPVRRYIVLQIDLLYRRKRTNSTILFDTIYTDGGIKTPEEKAAEHEREKPYKNDEARKKAIRQFAKADRTKVFAILESYKKRDYIKDYTVIKEGSKYTGVKLKLNPKKYKDKEITDGKKWTNNDGRLLKELI